MEICSACSGSVQRDYMQLSVVFIPVELGQRWDFYASKKNNKSMPIKTARPALFGVRSAGQLFTGRA